ncbi:MAG: aquaporin family protein [Candidatus Thermoplasmatota archaeon]|nr:aquaporin family protein [Candidatus Thermoplasmatota archaeon]
MANGLLKRMGGEVLGTFILLLFGCGVVANVGLAPRLASAGYDWLAITFGWALGVIVAVYVVGGVSGAHLNPAVTIAFAAKKKFPASEVIPYIIAQTLGAFLGAAGAFFAYHDGMVAAGYPNIYCTGPGSIFGQAFWGSATGIASSGQYTLYNSIFTEFIGTTVLLWGILAAGDSKNMGFGKTTAPIIVGATVLGIGLVLGGPTGYAINPARDFGPRLFGALSGTTGLFDGWYWLIVPILTTIAGALFGIFTYDWFVTAALPKPKEEEKPAIAPAAVQAKAITASAVKGAPAPGTVKQIGRVKIRYGVYGKIDQVMEKITQK